MPSSSSKLKIDTDSAPASVTVPVNVAPELLTTPTSDPPPSPYALGDPDTGAIVAVPPGAMVRMNAQLVFVNSVVGQVWAARKEEAPAVRAARNSSF